MKFLLIAFALLSSQAFADDARYFACETNADCVETKGTCGGRVSINKKFVTEFDVEGRAAAAGARCGSPDPVMAKAKMKTACLKSKCDFDEMKN